VAEEEGMVHTTGVTEKAWLCNCHRDYCVNLVPLREHGIPLDRALVKSEYQPAIDDAECNGCQVCVDYCPFEAIEMVKVAGSRRLKAAADLEKCRGCGICAINCNVEAIAMTQVAAVV
jgi:Pyruvate/2-oxoacid:ferredoxin oxidoreductase delta subunit